MNLKMLCRNRWMVGAALVIGLSTIGRATAGFADVTGKVTLEGTPPTMPDIDMSSVKECANCHPDPIQKDTVVVSDKGELKNVIISLKLADGEAAPGGEAAEKPPADAVTIDQKGCMYEPHVAACMAGQKVVFKNSDPTIHNVDLNAAKENENKGNQGMPKGCDDFTYTPKAAENKPVQFKCDVHPWMSGYLAIFDNPYFAVTGDDGSFTIKNLPDGTYTLQAWHEEYGTQTGKITVKDGKATIDFKFKVEEKK